MFFITVFFAYIFICEILEILYNGKKLTLEEEVKELIKKMEIARKF